MYWDLRFKYLLAGMALVFSFYVATTATANESPIIFVPIGVGDITIFVPTLNEDFNSNGVPDYDDPDLAPGQLLSSLCAALSLGSIDIAVRFISPVQKERYREAFLNLGTESAEICADLNHVELISANETVREWTARRYVNGELRAYILTEVRDSDGVFRFTEF